MPPLGKIRVTYGLKEHNHGLVEVLVGDRVVCQLPASEITWKLKAGEVGVVEIQVIAQRAEVEGVD